MESLEDGITKRSNTQPLQHLLRQLFFRREPAVTTEHGYAFVRVGDGATEVVLA